MSYQQPAAHIVCAQWIQSKAKSSTSLSTLTPGKFLSLPVAVREDLVSPTWFEILHMHKTKHFPPQNIQSPVKQRHKLMQDRYSQREAKVLWSGSTGIHTSSSCCSGPRISCPQPRATSSALLSSAQPSEPPHSTNLRKEGFFCTLSVLGLW